MKNNKRREVWFSVIFAKKSQKTTPPFERLLIIRQTYSPNPVG